MAKSIAIVVTTRNEEENIRALLDSIIIQTKKPNEVVILDADSQDNTRKIISSYKTKIKNLKIIESKKVNRSIGRNKAIKASESDIIAITDSGCMLKKDWLEKITHPILTKEAEVVAGFYLTENKSVMERSSAPFVAVMPDNIDLDTFLPSSRSIAFTKSSWEKVGGYPEDVSYCEDLTFAQMLKHTSELVVQPRAIVYWNHYSDVYGFFNQIKNYASGDVEAWHIPHIRKIATVYLRYVLFLVFFPIFYIYLLWPIYKHYKYVKHPLGILTLPLFQLLTDAGIFLGSFVGVMRRVGI